MKMILWPWLATLPLLCSAGEIPEPILPAGVGVNIHFVTGQEKDLDRIAAAGFRFVRMDFHWAGIERTNGVYDWAGYEELLANLDKRGLRALFILDYSNPLYEATVTSTNPITGQLHKNTASPQRPESVAAFARWAAAAAKYFQGRRIIWEIWNEPNIHFWSPEPDVEQYVRLALATCKAIREVAPQATVVAPATSGFPWAFLETCFKSGLLEHLDGVSVHPYRDYRQPPETAAGDYQKLRGLIERYAPPLKKGKIAILSGEWGYATHDKGVSLETQGAFAARQQLANLLSGVPLSIWYDWKNDGPDPKEREHNFGTVTADLKPKPAYVAIQTLTRELGSCRLVRRLRVENENDYVLLFVTPKGEHKLAAWTLGAPHAIKLGVRPGESKITAVSGTGEALALQTEAGRLVLVLKAMPQYIALGAATLEGE